MKRITVTAVFIGLLLFPLIQVEAEKVTDWGGFADSLSGLQYDGTADFQQEARLGLWIDTSFSEAFSLEGQGSYLYSLSRPFFASLDRLVLDGEFLQPGEEGYRLNVRTGRFRFSEFSGYVLDHRLDGVNLSLDVPGLSLSAGAGFSGLLFAPNNRILVTGSDVGVEAAAPESGYGLAPPKLIERLEVTFPQLFLRQDVTLSLLAQQDLQRDEDVLNAGDRIHTEYLGLAFSGMSRAELFHRLYGYFNYGHGAYATAAFLIGGQLSYYREELNFSRFTVEMLYSSGDPAQGSYYGGYTGGDASGHFIPLSHAEHFGLVFSPSPGNIAVSELAYSVKPFSELRQGGLNNLQIEFTVLSFLRSSTGAVSEGDINAASSQLYLGSEADLRISYRPFSDLGINLTGGLFFPNNYTAQSAMSQSGSAVEPGGRLEVSLRF